MATDEEARAARDARLQQLHERLTAAVDQLCLLYTSDAADE